MILVDSLDFAGSSRKKEYKLTCLQKYALLTLWLKAFHAVSSIHSLFQSQVMSMVWEATLTDSLV